jgi:DNA polymerase-3 subunit beta
MDVTVSKKDLLRLAKRAQAVADKKSAVAVLSNVLLDATGSNNELVVRATDLYLSVTGSTHAEIKRKGSVAVPAKDLFDRVNAMPDGPLLLSSPEGGGSMTIKAAGSARRYTLHGVGAEFPQLPQPQPGANRLTLPAELVKRLIGHTKFSVSPDDTRPNLNSAMFEWDGNRIRMVTTDGHRLSKIEVLAPEMVKAPAMMLLPLKAILELERLTDEAISEAKETKEAPHVTLIPSEPNAFFEVGGVLFGVKLVEAQFPSYKKVIPEQSSRLARIPLAAFSDALKAMRLSANDRTGGIKLTLTPGTLRITSESPDSGDGLDELPMDYSGTEISIGFNAKYFEDVLAALKDDADEVLLGLSGELDPAVLRPAISEEQAKSLDFVAVVMPMRI